MTGQWTPLDLQRASLVYTEQYLAAYLKTWVRWARDPSQ